MKNKISSTLLIVIAALLLTACKFQATTTVKPGGSGELRTEVGFSAEERQNMQKQSGANSGDFCNTSNAPADATVTEEQRGDETWCVTTTSFRNLDALRQLYGQKKGLTINRLEIAGGKFYYDVDIDTSTQDSSFSGFTAIGWTLTLPGAPISHNATRAEGNTLTWTLEPRSGTVKLQAESEAPQVFPSVSALLLIGLLAAALLGVASFWMRRARK